MRLPKLYDETGKRAQCLVITAPYHRCKSGYLFPDRRCTLHTEWLDGTLAERRAFHRIGGMRRVIRALAWATFRKRWSQAAMRRLCKRTAIEWPVPIARVVEKDIEEIYAAWKNIERTPVDLSPGSSASDPQCG